MSRQSQINSEVTERPPAVRASVALLAKRLGLDASTVHTGIKLGRLTRAVLGFNARGKVFIADLEAAVAEWGAQTRPRLDAKRQNGSARPSDLAAATVRERIARAEKFELETERARRLLVPSAEVKLRWSAHVVAARTKLLGIPSRAKQRLPHLTAADLATLDRLIREALEELGDE